MKLPIRTNMGTTSPKGKLIGVRELYVYDNGDKYELWIGDNDKGTATQLLVSESYKSHSVNTGTGNMLSVERDSTTGIVAGLDVKIETIDGKGDSVYNVIITPRTADSDVTLKSVNLKDIKKLVVSKDNYGTTLPETGEDGQLFFKI